MTRTLSPPNADSVLLQELRWRNLMLEEEIAKLRTAIVCALNEMLDLKDLNTGLHSSRLAEWAVRVGEQMGLPQSDLADLERGAILHDIGKNGVPESILNKSSALDSEERKQIEKHPEYGWAILRVVPGFQNAALLVLHHHEWIDGSGYPAGLCGDEIPLGSKIISVIDSFDAMVSDRAYRKGFTVAEALRRLHASSGRQFEERIARLFSEIVTREIRDVNNAVAMQ
jgi:HD-GYP domain-containing protein (c-di-GMP phosphodiesterase class II)